MTGFVETVKYPQINETSLIRPGFNMSNKHWGGIGLGFVLDSRESISRALIADHMIQCWLNQPMPSEAEWCNETPACQAYCQWLNSQARRTELTALSWSDYRMAMADLWRAWKKDE